MSERFDAIVIGSGAAGLSVALAARGVRVAVVTRGVVGLDGASCWAQSGIAAAIGPGDSPAAHAQDTMHGGCRLGNRLAARWLAECGPEVLEWLIDCGMQFDRQHGKLALAREAGHACPRSAHAGGDATGAELMRVLREAVDSQPWVTVFEFVEALRLRRRGAAVVGVRVRDRQGEEVDLLAPSVVLATGGLGQLYRHTTNPIECDGSGIALAHLAGAALTDLEFVQFHPTALMPRAGQEPDQLPVLAEGLRGAGAVLIDEQGQRLMASVHPAADLAPRDVVARAVQQRLDEGGRVFLDARMLGAALPVRFPTVHASCLALGINPRIEAIPVVPAAHYLMGGIKVDLHGQSSVPGLYAVGEVACAGVHGANRLGGNGLLEAIAFGRELGIRLARQGGTRPQLPDDDDGLSAAPSTTPDRAVQQRLREIVSRAVGVFRQTEVMLNALDQLDLLERRMLPGSRLLDRVLVARLLIESALSRGDSVGSHQLRADRGPGHSWVAAAG